MKCRELIEILEELAPVSLACDWDNPGLLAGRSDKEVRTVYLALDATDDVIDNAVECRADMIITHHPLIFKPLKDVYKRQVDILVQRVFFHIQPEQPFRFFDVAVRKKGKPAVNQLQISMQGIVPFCKHPFFESRSAFNIEACQEFTVIDIGTFLLY